MRRSVLGVLLSYVVIAVVFSAAAGGSAFGILVLATTFALSGVVVHKAIVRLSAGMR